MAEAWWRTQLNRLTKRYKTEEPSAEPFSNKPLKTVDYLYNAGFLGTGAEADDRRALALNLSQIVRSFSLAQKSEDARDRDEDITKLILKKSGLAELGSLEDLAEDGVNPEKALKAVEKAHASTPNRILHRISFGRLGPIRAANQQLANMVAYYQLSNTLDKLTRLAEQEGTIKPGESLSMDTPNVEAFIERAINAEDKDDYGCITNRLKSAHYIQQHPNMLHHAAKDYGDFLSTAYSTVQNSPARDNGGRSYMPFGEVLVEAGLLLDANNTPLPAPVARDVMDIVLLQKTGSRLTQLHGVTNQLHAEFSAVLPKTLDGVYQKPQAVHSLQQQFSGLGSILAAHFPTEYSMPSHWNTDIRTSKPSQDQSQNIMNLHRSARRDITDYAHALGETALVIAEQLQEPTLLQDAAMQATVSANITAFMENLSDLNRQSGHMASNALALSALQYQTIMQQNPDIAALPTLQNTVMSLIQMIDGVPAFQKHIASVGDGKAPSIDALYENSVEHTNLISNKRAELRQAVGTAPEAEKPSKDTHITELASESAVDTLRTDEIQEDRDAKVTEVTNETQKDAQSKDATVKATA